MYPDFPLDLIGVFLERHLTQFLVINMQKLRGSSQSQTFSQTLVC